MHPAIDQKGSARREIGERGANTHSSLEGRIATQDVFAALFAHDGRALRAWDPARGLSLPNFVGLVAERHVATLMRSRSKNPSSSSSDSTSTKSRSRTSRRSWG